MFQIGDMVEWIDPTTINNRYNPIYGFIIGIEVMNDETYYQINWFGHKKRMYTEKSIRKIS
jgi:hypothetical protein